MCGPVVCLDNGSAYVIPVMCSRLIDLLPSQSVALSHVNLSFFSISIHFNLSLYSINSNHGTGGGRGGRGGGGGGNACIMAFAGQSVWPCSLPLETLTLCDIRLWFSSGFPLVGLVGLWWDRSREALENGQQHHWTPQAYV